MTIAGWRRIGFHGSCRSLGKALVLSLAVAVAVTAQAAESGESALRSESSLIQVTFDGRQPGLSALSIDSLKRGSFRPSPIVDSGAPAVRYTVTSKNGWIQYALNSNPRRPIWEMRCEGNILRMRSFFKPNGASKDMTWKFNPDVTHATLLGHVTPGGDVALPAVLHLPGMGSLRIYANRAAALHYDARRNTVHFVSVTFPAATEQHKLMEYTLETAAIFPALPGVAADDARFDGFRRDFLDIFQQQAEMHVLANNAASDACGFTVYEYADMARHTPELVKGLTALDLVRETLDRYLAGFLGYGMPGYKMYDSSDPDTQFPHPSLDTYPSLLIAAYDYADGSGDERWLRQNYKGLRKWADRMTAANADGSPLLEYPESGNSGSWTEKITVRPSNWWDTIGFAHQDAYANALGYRALRGMAALAERVGETADAEKYRLRAQQIHDAYAKAFVDPQAGVVAGWRSRDGQLHNYYFPFVNGIAVRYGLLDREQSRQVMDNILRKMESVGYEAFLET